jgi:hypothetical protein
VLNLAEEARGKGKKPAIAWQAINSKKKGDRFADRLFRLASSG